MEIGPLFKGHALLADGFKHVLFLPRNPGEMIQF